VHGKNIKRPVFVNDMIDGQKTWLDKKAVGVDGEGTVVILHDAKTRTWFNVWLPASRALRTESGFEISIASYAKLRRVPMGAKVIDLPVVDVRRRGLFGIGSRPLLTLEA
jgi:hypothetical protein